jgi:queuine tRNA-ribosyltransferase
MNFTLLHTDGAARSGVLTTDHGAFQTPAFMPVGTQGTVKAVTPAALEATGAEIMLSNTYHLYLRPGTAILEQGGGLHEFISWRRPILTDSGGYQVFSLSELRKIEENGVIFRSHLDGSSHSFTPESVVEIQRSIGSDIMMVLDECAPYPCTREYAAASNELTMRWAKRAKAHFLDTEPRYGASQALFAIVQGSVFPDLRTLSANTLVDMEFEGYAIGGLAVGESAPEMYDVVGLCTGILPAEKPRYLMGVGTPENILEAVERGVDMFDCVLPTRNGRNASLFTSRGPLTITNARFKNDFGPVDEACGCYTCSTFTRAYLRHLFQAHEILGLQLATIHNISFYQSLMRSAREAINAGAFATWKRETISSLRQEAPVLP